MVSKIMWGIWITSDKQWKPKKLNVNGLHLSKKYIPTAKTYTEDLSNITSNYYENLSNFLCHFWNHKLFFTTQLVSIFLAQTLHPFDRNIPSKSKFSDFPLLELKFTKLFMSSRLSFHFLWLCFNEIESNFVSVFLSFLYFLALLLN